jgi:hypothetical protein
VTRDEFDVAMLKLQVLRSSPADMEPYWEVFQHGDVEGFLRGVEQARKTRTFFPVPAELMADCDTARPVRTWEPPRTRPTALETFTHYIPNPLPEGGKGITITVDRNWKYNCEDCGDSGWLPMWCGGPAPKPWQFSASCGRRNEHTAHDWVQPCACWSSNPDVVARRERLADAAAKRAKPETRKQP